MPHTLILPKQTGQVDVFYASLQLYYQAHEDGKIWYSNTDYKREIQKLLPYLSQGAQNGPYLVKQSELTRYFGLVYYDYSTTPGRAKITDIGIRFYNAYLHNNNRMQLSIIMESIFHNSFGRNNTAIKNSNSDVDAPKLFLRSIYDFNGITRKGFAYLLYVVHDKRINYSDALAELRKVDNKDREIPIEVSNKYNDVKFTVLLTSLGIVDEKDGKYYLSDFTKKEYGDRIKKLQIYNKKPELIMSLKEDDTLYELTPLQPAMVMEPNFEYVSDEYENNDQDEEDIKQEKVITSCGYDINSKKFIEQNNRAPTSYTKGNSIKYKTNSRIAKTALELAEYKCQYEPNKHITFMSKLGKPYMEAHHLIPMAAQKDFSINIDRIENIVSICPNCHSAIHLGDETTRIDLLKKLYEIKEPELKSVGINITFGELFSKYYK